MNNEFALVVDAWFDGETHRREATTFLVSHGRIECITPGDFGPDFEARGVPTERGAFLMPGLVDAHVHLFLDGAAKDNPVRSSHLKKPLETLIEAARQSARQSLGCGVTWVRDAGDRHGINNRIRDEAVSSHDLARVRSGGQGVKRAKRYGAFMAMDVDDAASIVDSVGKLAADNDEIKLILTGIIDFDACAVTDEPQFDLESTKLVVETAKGHGRKTFAHCSGEKGVAIAAHAGVGSVEHGFFMTRETLAVMCENRVAWTPTFSPVHFQWAQPEAAGWSDNTVGNLRRILDRHGEQLRLADQLGVPLLMGTDAGSMGVEHGHAMFDEIDRYLEAGLSLEKTLKAATATARRHFSSAHPLLACGSPFEAVLLARSPFDHLPSLRRPLRVWRQSAQEA